MLLAPEALRRFVRAVEAFERMEITSAAQVESHFEATIAPARIDRISPDDWRAYLNDQRAARRWLDRLAALQDVGSPREHPKLREARKRELRSELCPLLRRLPVITAAEFTADGRVQVQPSSMSGVETIVYWVVLSVLERDAPVAVRRCARPGCAHFVINVYLGRAQPRKYCPGCAKKAIKADVRYRRRNASGATRGEYRGPSID
jgi:hypothetical protein